MVGIGILPCKASMSTRMKLFQVVLAFPILLGERAHHWYQYASIIMHEVLSIPLTETYHVHDAGSNATETANNTKRLVKQLDNPNAWKKESFAWKVEADRGRRLPGGNDAPRSEPIESAICVRQRNSRRPAMPRDPHYFLLGIDDRNPA